MGEAALDSPLGIGSRLMVSNRAAGSSFYAAMRILPLRQRQAMFEIYSFCRFVDDIADCGGPRVERIAQLEKWRADIAGMYEGKVAPRVRALANAARDFDLHQDDFLAVIDGMEMDVAADIRAPSLETLDLYCDRVASAVGRLSAVVFGMERKSGIGLAHHLGRALQLTNILRDLDRDAEIGRLYLPREYLQDACIDVGDPEDVLRSPRLALVCNRLAKKAQTHFDQAKEIMAQSPRRVVRAPRIMAAVYRSKLDKLVRRGWAEPRRDISAGRLQLAWILLRFAFV